MGKQTNDHKSKTCKAEIVSLTKSNNTSDIRTFMPIQNPVEIEKCRKQPLHYILFYSSIPKRQKNRKEICRSLNPCDLVLKKFISDSQII